MEQLKNKKVLVTGAGGFIRAAVAENVTGNTYNLGVGEDISIGDIAKEIIRLIGRPVSIEIDKQRLRPEKSEVMRLISDNSLANLALDWRPVFSLSAGLQKTTDWVERNLDEFRIGIY